MKHEKSEIITDYHDLIPDTDDSKSICSKQDSKEQFINVHIHAVTGKNCETIQESVNINNKYIVIKHPGARENLKLLDLLKINFLENISVIRSLGEETKFNFEQLSKHKISSGKYIAFDDLEFAEFILSESREGLQERLNPIVTEEIKNDPCVIITSNLPHSKHNLLVLETERVVTSLGVEVRKITLLDSFGRIIMNEYIKVSGERTINNHFNPTNQFAHSNMNGIRRKLRKIIGNNTVLLGFSILYDTRALKIHCDRLADTGVLFRSDIGFSFPFGKLRELTSLFLDKKIQRRTNGRIHHECIEDGIAILALSWFYFGHKEVVRQVMKHFYFYLDYDETLNNITIDLRDDFYCSSDCEDKNKARECYRINNSVKEDAVSVVGELLEQVDNGDMVVLVNIFEPELNMCSIELKNKEM